MANIPANFTGTKFCAKFNKNPEDFRIVGVELICPSLPDLLDSDLADCVINSPPPPSTEERIVAMEDTILAMLLGG